MLTLDTLTLFFSWRCNVACRHCGFSCGPERRGSMPVERALSFIDQAACCEALSVRRGQPGLNMVAYSGGEPFLYHDRLVQCMSHAHQLGFSGGVVTNCFWASSARIAQRRLDRLAELGLQEIIVSLDDLHLQHIPLEQIRYVVHAALQRGVRVGVNMLVVRNSHVRKSLVPELLELAPDILEEPKRIWARESSPLLVGRARSHFRREDLYHYGAAQLRGNPCYFVVRNMVVTPDENLYACCGFGDASADGPASIAYAGDLGHSSLTELFDQAAGNLLLNILATYGPWVLLDLVHQADPAVPFRQEYVSNCDICDEISTNLPLRRMVGQVLRDAAQSVIAPEAG